MPDGRREQQLRELFDQAMDRPAAERAPFVDAVDDEVLRERLRALVLQDGSPTIGALRLRTPDGPQRLGGYELLRVLGRGGMGIVFLGLQQEPVERLVAIKLLAERDDDGEADQRLRNEQRAMMRMDHPGIARVLDVGTAEDGAPFLVMEYVPGEPLLQYCDRRRLGLAARIELVVGICDAVQHAHQKGVIHRDLKPSNILVTDAGGRAQPKVIDFGLARATAGRLTRMRPTMPGAVVGTLLYMSPEQAQGSQDIDTRTDVFALGAVLHELLVGAPPLGTGDGDGAFLRALADLEAGRFAGLLATARGLAPELAAERAEQRGTSVSGWLRALDSDLVPIVAKALAVDRARRYATASELGADLVHHLRGEPVVARPPTVAYLLARFTSRHRVGVATGLAVGVLVVLSALAALSGMLSARRARDAEAIARRHLEQVAARQQAVQEFGALVELYGDPGLRGEAPSLRQSLQAARSKVPVRWRGRPQQQAAVHRALGRSLLALGEPVAAMEELRAAWRVLLPLADVDPGFSTEVLADLSRAERQANELDASRSHLVQLLQLGAAAVEARAPSVAQRLAATSAAIGDRRMADAVVELRAAMDAMRVLGRSGPAFEIAAAATFAPVVQLFQDGEPGSDELLTRVESVARDLHGDEPEFASVLARLAEMRLRVGQHPMVLALANELLAMAGRLGLTEHWLVAQAERQRGLALALGVDAARGEAELVALHGRLVRFVETGNEQVRAAIGSLGELCRRLEQRQDLDAFLRASFERWRERAAANADVAPWWPVADEGCATGAALASALQLVADAPEQHRDALAGAALLHLGRLPAAVERLEAAVRVADHPGPELLADLAVALQRSGRRAAARRAAAQLREAAADREGPRWLRARHRILAIE
jgi:non-specific serine/threonine protein kinase/serine/threonine-protein kinase